jgi:hypothetical protein
LGQASLSTLDSINAHSSRVHDGILSWLEPSLVRGVNVAKACIGEVFHVEHFVLANLYGRLYTCICK